MFFSFKSGGFSIRSWLLCRYLCENRHHFIRLFSVNSKFLKTGVIHPHIPSPPPLTFFYISIGVFSIKMIINWNSFSILALSDLSIVLISKMDEICPWILCCIRVHWQEAGKWHQFGLSPWTFRFLQKSFLYDPRINLKCFFPSNQGASQLGPGFYAGISVKTGFIL